MENPHEQVQNALLARIIDNVVRVTGIIYYMNANLVVVILITMTEIQEKLNESVIDLNKTLKEINNENMNVELLSQMWENYQRNVLFHLESTDQLQPPS